MSRTDIIKMITRVYVKKAKKDKFKTHCEDKQD